MSTGTQYSLYVVNNSPQETFDFTLFQQDPDIGTPDVMSLAWLVKKAHPGTTLKFEWTIDYSFVWAETGVLQPGVLFEASQVVPADPSLLTKNQILFDYEDGAYLFEPGQVHGTPQIGTLYIAELAHVPENQASVGIGMSGSGTFAVQAESNLLATFTPHPEYWLAAGTFQQGEVVDVGQITMPQPIEYQAGSYVMTAVLNGDNTWTVYQGPPQEAVKTGRGSRNAGRNVAAAR